jgi:hypothetical protein
VDEQAQAQRDDTVTQCGDLQATAGAVFRFFKYPGIFSPVSKIAQTP